MTGTELRWRWLVCFVAFVVAAVAALSDAISVERDGQLWVALLLAALGMATFVLALLALTEALPAVAPKTEAPA